MTLIDTLTTSIVGIAGATWDIFAEAAPYLFLGFGIAGLLHAFVPDEKIVAYLGTSAGKVRSVVNAAFAGVPLPLCSCGVVPTAISLQKRGATRGATVSFLISTPETGVDSIAITYALLDPIMTIFRPLATFVTAVSAGILDNLLIKDKSSVPTTLQTIPLATSYDENTSCSCGGACGIPTPQGQSLSQRIYGGIKYAYVDLLGDISKWLIVGIVIAGIVSYAIPESMITSYLGGGIGSMLIMLVVGIPLYICATASTPLAAAFIAKGMSPGTAFVFLLAGPATNAATITMVAKFLGKRSAALYLASIVIFSIAFGLLLDFIYIKIGIEASSIVGHASEVLPDDVKTLFAIMMLPLIVNGIYHEMRE
ncbi:MAG: SO_0444 family Cu/Zn efflux transporter [Methanosarcinaceae archaeon]|nr:SO_0444 family Cu/Zn efflux transporter [Methanosarcinaceae archaeon]